MGKKALLRLSDGDIFPLVPQMMELPGYEVIDLDEYNVAPKKRGRPKKEPAETVPGPLTDLDDLSAGVDSGETDNQ